MVKIVSSLIIERFPMMIQLVNELTNKLHMYFEFSGDMNNETYLFMVNCKEWPLSKGAESNQNLNMITVPVPLLLAKLGS